MGLYVHYHGIGNQFLLINAHENNNELQTERKWVQMHAGTGNS